MKMNWPTENHDFRRTGFTLLKGDMSNAKSVDNISYVLEPGGISAQEQVVKAIVADADGNGAMEVVSFVHKNTQSNQTRIYAVETKKKDNTYAERANLKVKTKWIATSLGIGGAGGATYFPGTLANVDLNNYQESVVFNNFGGVIYGL